MRILDLNGHEITSGDPVLFTLSGDLYEGTLISVKGRLLPIATVSYRDRWDALHVIKALKLAAIRTRRQLVHLPDGGEAFRTYRLRLLRDPGGTQETSQNSVPVET